MLFLVAAAGLLLLFWPLLVHYASACCKNEEGCCVLNKALIWLQEWERKECKFSLSSLLHKWTLWQLWLLICSVCSVSANFGAAARSSLNLLFIPKDCGQVIDLFKGLINPSSPNPWSNVIEVPHPFLWLSRPNQSFGNVAIGNLFIHNRWIDPLGCEYHW